MRKSIDCGSYTRAPTEASQNSNNCSRFIISMTRRQMFQNKASVRSLNRDNRSSLSLDKASLRPYQTKFSLIESKVEDNLMRQEQTVRVFSQTKMTSFIHKGFLTGSILSQGKIGKDKPIAYASRSLSDTEKNTTHMKKKHLQ